MSLRKTVTILQSFSSEEVEHPIPVVPHNGFQEENQKLYDKEGENREEKRDSAKLNITCSSIVTKVQNGGVTRHGKGGCKYFLAHDFLI